MKVDDSVAEELAWFFLPEGAFERVSTIHHGQSGEAVKRALIQEGLFGAHKILDIIQAQIARLDVLWKEAHP